MPNKNSNRNSSDDDHSVWLMLALLIRRSGGTVVLTGEEIRSSEDGVIHWVEGDDSVTLWLRDREATDA